jgi:hypothetical protein
LLVLAFGHVDYVLAIIVWVGYWKIEFNVVHQICAVLIEHAGVALNYFSAIFIGVIFFYHIFNSVIKNQTHSLYELQWIN